MKNHPVWKQYKEAIMIRILHSVSNMDRAGIETMLMNFYRHMDREQVQFDFLQNKPDPGDYDEEIRELGGRLFVSPGFLSYPKYEAYMTELLKEHPEYKIIHTHNGSLMLFALKAAQKNNVPIRIAHAHATAIPPGWKNEFKKLLKPRIKYADLLREKFNVDVFNPDREQLIQVLLENWDAKDLKRDEFVKKLENTSTPHLIDDVWKLIRKTSAGPYWLIEEPLSLSPLAKKSPENPLVTERFHPIIAGTEMGNGFSELNDPWDQLERFKEQQAARDAGDEEAQMMDQDFVEMLEYGMPPACGWGNSERNFWLLEGVPGREAVPFPTMRRADSE